MKQRNRKSKKKKSVSWGLVLFEVIGWIILAGMLAGIYDTSRMISMILNAKPITQLSADTTGIIRLEGPASSPIEVTEQGILRKGYALIQKEPFYWRCSRGCDYKPNNGANPQVWGSISVLGVEVQADRYRFYKSWLPLNRLTIETDHLLSIYEGGTTRPLLVEEQDSTAHGYHTVSLGEKITVIGNAVHGRIEPIKIANNEMPAVLIGDNIKQMVTKEKKERTAYTLIGILVVLLLSPLMIGRIRRFLGREERRG
ncbi:hypothetical protein [Paenibacillus dakarensis]|uniref:hypothetical protein n=1 Tax=Paenibacillus dakarensis TaxID=1527293 RepID=UPI0006D5B3A0|nr:hypothetical protein [Paenibacillus dakarensis]